MKKKVVIIGLDGATWDLLIPWIERGKLPTLEKMLDEGTWGTLKSTIPPWSIPAWNSLSTGLNPGKLGFSSFIVKEGYDFKPYFTVVGRQRNNIWDILSRKGIRVCIAGLPNIHQAYSINGYMIAGWLSIKTEDVTYPKELIHELRRVCKEPERIVKIVPNNDIYQGDSLRDIKITDKDYISTLYNTLVIRFLIYRYLLRKKDWNFAFVAFTETDVIQHRFFKHKKILLDFYVTIDTIIDELIKVCGENTAVFVVSDHGFGPKTRSFYVNEWLIKKGYLTLKGNEIKFDFLAKPRRSVMHIIRPLRSILNLIPPDIKNFARKKVLRRKQGIERKIWSIDELNVDWSATKAFSYGFSGEIWLNILGREPEGCIDPKDYRRVRNEIIEELKKVGLSVFKKEEVFLGDKTKNLPDIVITTNDYINELNPYIGVGEVIREIHTSSGEHRIDGIFLAYGPGIRQNNKIEKAVEIYDIAPTILHLFDVPISVNLDGKVLIEIFDKDSEYYVRKPRIIKETIVKKDKDLETQLRKVRQKLYKIKAGNVLTPL